MVLFYMAFMILCFTILASGPCRAALLLGTHICKVIWRSNWTHIIIIEWNLAIVYSADAFNTSSFWPSTSDWASLFYTTTLTLLREQSDWMTKEGISIFSVGSMYYFSFTISGECGMHTLLHEIFWVACFQIIALCPLFFHVYVPNTKSTYWEEEEGTFVHSLVEVYGKRCFLKGQRPTYENTENVVFYTGVLNCVFSFPWEWPKFIALGLFFRLEASSLCFYTLYFEEQNSGIWKVLKATDFMVYYFFPNKNDA